MASLPLQPNCNRARLAGLSLLMFITACGGSGGSSGRTTSQNPNDLTVQSVSDSNQQSPATTNFTLLQGQRIITDSSTQGTLSIPQSNLSSDPITVIVSANDHQTLILHDWNNRAVKIGLNSTATPTTVPITVTTTGIPGPFPANTPTNPGPTFVATVSTARGGVTLPAGVDSGAQLNGDSELTAIGSTQAFTIPLNRLTSEAVTISLADFTSPSPFGGPTTYFALLNIPNGLDQTATNITLDVFDGTQRSATVEGSIMTTADFDLSNDTIQVKPRAFCPGTGLVDVGGVSENNTITGSNQSADFGFSSSPLTYVFMYDTDFRDNYAYEVAVSNSTIASTRYIRGTYAQISRNITVSLPAPAPAFTVDTMTGALTPTIQWSTAANLNGHNNGYYELTITGNGESFQHVAPATQTSVTVPIQASLSAGVSYTVTLRAIEFTAFQGEAISRLHIEEFASTVTSRTQTYTTP